MSLSNFSLVSRESLTQMKSRNPDCLNTEELRLFSLAPKTSAHFCLMRLKGNFDEHIVSFPSPALEQVRLNA
jgi:hypothetical protein